MAEELEPCPFCGGEADCGWFAGDYDISCVTCQFSISRHISDFGTGKAAMEAAIRAWNTRATPKAKHGELKAMTDAVWSEYQGSISKKWTFRKEHVDNAIRRALAELKGQTND